ncbi:hypothetical protein SEA_WEASELS2_61 [Rhodococcus phage Weasels2]|uniref:Uncharacterized protein n=1 Tax=Rhodococcus phage Weasels2 TaxID=1897437 RepID=A0A1I9SA44_9CAUD|nr:hypothetical protein FDH04_gp061 [Rhodococcus phage Weasels2]AOZ63650.1 hypothetical protein SEA_WEASELS2_61 [Rhodococcus phage Weasels2]
MRPVANKKALQRPTPLPPELVIQRAGKYWFYSYIRYDNHKYKGWYKLGYERAYKKGQKELRKFNERLSYLREVRVFNAD